MKHSILSHLLFLVLTLFASHGHANSFAVEEFSVLSINSAITPATFDYLKHQLNKIPEKSLVIIKINTPGGLVSTTKDIISLIGNQSKPVAIWITPAGASASSAGAIIASSAHFIFMSPGTNIGAATPVGLGEDIQETDGKKKAVNDLTAMVRSLSDLRQRPSKPFEDMITKASSLTDQEALKENIINGVVSTQSQLIEKIDGLKFKIKGVEHTISIKSHSLSVAYKPSLGQEILEVLANPQTAYFLFLIGIALLYFEFQAPGGYIMGGIGLCFLTLAAISFQVLPLNWGALSLILIGAVLLIMEIFITSYGILGVSGLVSFVMGSLFLFHGDSGFISVEYPILISTMAGVISATGIIAWVLFREKKTKNSPGAFFLPVDSTGIVMTVKDTRYQVKVKGEIWNATSSEALSLGEKIKVIDVDNEKLVLNIIKDKESP